MKDLQQDEVRGDHDIARHVMETSLWMKAIGKPTVRESVWDETVRDLMLGFIELAKTSEPVSKTERCVVSVTMPKTAALIADRVWLPNPADPYPPGTYFALNTGKDVRMRTFIALNHYWVSPPVETWAQKSEAAGVTLEDSDVEPINVDDINDFVKGLEKAISADWGQTFGARVTPMFDSIGSHNLQYKAGDVPTILSIIDNVSVVDESNLTWDQVMGFRENPSARQAMDRFVHWLDKEMLERSASFIANKISERQENYEAALYEHNIKTVIGSLKATLDPKNLVGASSVGAATQMITNSEIASLLTVGGLVVGKASLAMAEIFLERSKIERQHQEIAFVQEISELDSS